MIGPDGKHGAVTGASEDSFGNVRSTWGYAFGILPGGIYSGQEVNQMFPGAEGSGQGPWVGVGVRVEVGGWLGKGPEIVCNSKVKHFPAITPSSQFADQSLGDRVFMGCGWASFQVGHDLHSGHQAWGRLCAWEGLEDLRTYCFWLREGVS